MVQRIVCLALLAAFSLGGAGCKPKTASPAALNAAKQAAWQARQKQQAIKYYNDLITNYPDSPYTAQAKERLSALGPASPAPKK